MTTQTIDKSPISINDVMAQCNIPAKAIEVYNNLSFFLQTQSDREAFISKYNKKTISHILAKEIGSHHYTYNNLSELLAMDEKSAIEHLYCCPINDKMFRQYQESGATVEKLHTLLMTNPKINYLMLALMYI